MKYRSTKYSRLAFVPAAVLFATATVPTVAYRLVTARDAAAEAAVERGTPVFLASDASGCDASVAAPAPALAAATAAQPEAVATLSE
ncbi:MAG: hypothetical protein JWO31_2758 [Phycisphaerales bacterium]|nr:hypothetical protein [Phycisphaerales bacterium]